MVGISLTARQEHGACPDRDAGIAYEERAAVSACQRRHDADDADGHRRGFPAGRRVEAGLVAVARLTGPIDLPRRSD